MGQFTVQLVANLFSCSTLLMLVAAVIVIKGARAL